MPSNCWTCCTASRARQVRAEYESSTLRGPVPENRCTAARQAGQAAGVAELSAARL